MFSVDQVAGPSSGPPLWIEIVAVALLAGGATYLVGRAAVASLVRRIRRADVASASVVAEIVTCAAGGDDPDVVVIRAAYELKNLLGLADCRWAWVGDPLPTATLADDGSIQFGAFRWPSEREGLPPRGVKRELSANGRTFGSIVLVPADARPVPLTRLRGAATTIDVIALCLDQHRHPALPGPSV